jgi:hypothetical protein
MKLYDNGEPILKDNIEDEAWYSFYHMLSEITCDAEFTFLYIEDPNRLVDLFNVKFGALRKSKHYKNTFPSDDQILRWAVLSAERHNHTYNCPDLIKPWREEYLPLKVSLKVWTDIDIAMLEIALIAKKTGFPEFFKDLKKGGLIKNKFWIYNNGNPLSVEVRRILNGLTSFGIIQLHSKESQYRWMNKTKSTR